MTPCNWLSNYWGSLQDIINFQKQHEQLFDNNRIVKLAYHLVVTKQCNQVNKVFLFDEEYLMMGCDTGYFAFKYQEFADNLVYEFSDHLIIKMPFIEQDERDNHVGDIINACQKSNQIDFNPDKTLDVVKIKQVLTDCDTDEIHPYRSCLGIYYGQLSQEPKVNYFNLLIFHVKDTPMSSQCVVTVSDAIADQILQIKSGVTLSNQSY